MRRSAGILRALGLGVLVAGAACVPANAQEEGFYREGMPPVLAPSDEPSPAVASRAFRFAYERAGRPRLMVYWMRELSEAVSTPLVTREETTGAGVVDMAASGSGGALVGGYSETRETVTAPGPETVNDPLPEAQSEAIESAFIDALMQAGVRVVDRAAAIRLSAHAYAEADAAQRAAETAALRQRADVMVQVTAAGAGGFEDLSYRLSAIDTADGAVLASVVVPAADLDLAVTWKARDGGGFSGVVEPEALGRALAEQLQAQLAVAW